LIPIIKQEVLIIYEYRKVYNTLCKIKMENLKLKKEGVIKQMPISTAKLLKNEKRRIT
jgi:hypothetical protein